MFNVLKKHGKFSYKYIEDGIYIGQTPCCRYHGSKVLRDEKGVEAELSFRAGVSSSLLGVDFHIGVPMEGDVAPKKDQFDFIVATLTKFVAMEKKVYVYSKDDQAKAAAFVVAYLVSKGKSLKEAEGFVESKGISIHMESSQREVLQKFAETYKMQIEETSLSEEEVKKELDFYAVASHKLRSPTSGVKLLTETILGGALGDLTEKQKQYLNEIHSANDVMIRLVFGFFDIMQAKLVGIPVKKEVIKVSDLYSKELSEKMSLTAKNNKIILNNKLADFEALELYTDAEKVRNILESLISNAINFSKEGKEVILGAKKEENTLTFFVKDSGIGISDDEKDRIFEKFYRASNGKELRPFGVGLGLYFAKTFIEELGGKIWFESQEGEGSTFYFTIQLKP